MAEHHSHFVELIADWNSSFGGRFTKKIMK